MLDALKVLFILTGTITKFGQDTPNGTELTPVLAGNDYQVDSFRAVPKLTQASNRKPETNLNDAKIGPKNTMVPKGGFSRENVADKNQYLNMTYEISIDEEDSSDLPKLLLRVAPRQDRQQVFDKIVYYLNAARLEDLSAISDKFTVNESTGELYVLRPLNRDLPDGRPRWHLSIFAKYVHNNEPFAFVDIIINLRDINDCAPRFTRSQYVFNVSEDADVNLPVVVGQVIANDNDDVNVGLNARVRYSVDDSADRVTLDLFKMNSETGVISVVNCCLDCESRNRHMLHVVATDGDGLRGTATVIINVLDANDSPPLFIDKFMSTELTSDSLFRDELEPLYILSVADPDQPFTNNFFYRLTAKRLQERTTTQKFLDFPKNASQSRVATKSDHLPFLCDHFRIEPDADGNGMLYFSSESTHNLQHLITGDDMICNFTVTVSDLGGMCTPVGYDRNHCDSAILKVRITKSYGEDKCQIFKCFNGGTCVLDNSTVGFSCLCLPEFSGKFCAIGAQSDSLVVDLKKAITIAAIICPINVFVLLLITYIVFRARRKPSRSQQPEVKLLGQTESCNLAPTAATTPLDGHSFELANGSIDDVIADNDVDRFQKNHSMSLSMEFGGVEQHQKYNGMAISDNIQKMTTNLASINSGGSKVTTLSIDGTGHVWPTITLADTAGHHHHQLSPQLTPDIIELYSSDEPLRTLHWKQVYLPSAQVLSCESIEKIDSVADFTNNQPYLYAATQSGSPIAQSDANRHTNVKTFHD